MATITEISVPLPPPYQVIHTLRTPDGIWTLRWRFNRRAGVWVIDITHSSDGSVLYGLPVSPTDDLFESYRYRNVPVGRLAISHPDRRPSPQALFDNGIVSYITDEDPEEVELQSFTLVPQ